MEKCQKGTNNASYWLCSQWRMLSQEGILPWTCSVFCFGNVQASTGYQPWLLWWRSFSPSLVSFPSNPPVLLRICLSSFLFALTVFAPVSLAFFFFPHTNNSCFSVPLILRYLQWQHCLVNAEKAHEFYMALVQFQQLVPVGCAISFQNGRIQKPFGQQLMQDHLGCILQLWQDFKDGKNGLL